VYVSA
jgi:hypothetical protein